ncbi:hypothetical protein M8756_05105 [Lutimaribacter sp. EGI FJ00015]|uniref:Uncharacterized protein n=1 Tax=Lutimaribacter degradans TaxID=2945989 RepID=A0ACC5ZTW0_9RHOB|nr:hypothetical protein [Lutimaribacter sp. EGI FJ00013]MCM2561613.1 hypothetical protein [Lutimaribacter sp. EGI FJ00013]MCO0612676.1 hypothetical protein [Lutimaribacter sp. EGI FJ00015]MCO0635334.1 hypothetical protein [Lutimaribacter sp. EGI FJ00014]
MSDYANTPKTALTEDEAVLASFAPDRGTYIRDHAWLAAVAMAVGMGLLWAIGNPHVWTGAVGGLAAVAFRAWFVASDELATRWDLTDRRLLGPGTRAVPLNRIKAINTLGSAVQIVTQGGDKHMLKYQHDRDATRARIAAALAGRRDG